MKYFNKLAGSDRYFIGVAVPDNSKQQITSTKNKDNTHVTLTYLGAQDPNNLSSIAKTLENIANNTKEFTISAPFYGAFSKNIPYVGVERTNPLLTLRKALNKHELTKSVDNRDYIPHITIGANGQLPTNENISYTADKINLYQSNLSNPGNYSIVASYPLQKQNILDKLMNFIKQY